MTQYNNNINNDDNGQDFYYSLNLFQSTLRNIGLFTSLSLALLGYSRYYREKGNKLYNISFILISIISLFITIIIANNQYEHAHTQLKHLEKDEVKIMNDWLQIHYYIKCMVYSILGFSVYTLFRQLKKK